MQAFLLAAGLGTRLRPITDVYAKPAVPFLNVPLLFWSLELVRQFKPSSYVINLHHLPQTVKNLMQSAAAADLKVDWSLEIEAPLGSGGALTFAASHGLLTDDDLIVANADEVILPMDKLATARLMETHRRSGAIATLLTMKHPDAGTKFGGVWHDGAGNVFGFGRDRAMYPKAKGALHYVGLILLNKRVLKYLPETGESNLLYDGLLTAIKAGEKVVAHEEELFWQETGNAHDFLEATSAALSLLSPLVQTDAAALARKTVSKYAPAGTRYWQSESGAKMLISTLATGSLKESEICAHLEKEKAFAVIGANAKIGFPISNSAVLPNCAVASPLKSEIAY
jgi:mannose-1-phosphate guanylyltransferase